MKLNVSKFLSGDFLHHHRLQKWYPYFLLLISLAVVSIVNEKIINKKNKIIQKKQYEYKMALNQLKENNYYLPYNQKKIIREKATKRGFVENHKNMYKIVVKEEK
ncbi:MAG: FtsL-like putative cell division protein [Bacteroidetes bacterium]|nr:FtsL-like putative cell division protein [Bacteroidota bacterium]MCL1968005.1 FtsL-like putative cell division protein [Bacteroidota bacterium]